MSVADDMIRNLELNPDRRGGVAIGVSGTDLWVGVTPDGGVTIARGLFGAPEVFGYVRLEDHDDLRRVVDAAEREARRRLEARMDLHRGLTAR